MGGRSGHFRRAFVGTLPAAVQVVGIVTTTNGASGAYTMTLLGPNSWLAPRITRSDATGDAWTPVDDFSAEFTRAMVGGVATWTLGGGIMRTTTVAQTLQMPATLALSNVHKYSGDVNNFDEVWNSSTSRFEMTGNARFMSTLTLATALAVGDGGTGLTSFATNDIPYASGSTTLAKLAANSSATRKFLRDVSSGAPAWDTIAIGDVPSGIASSLLATANKTDQFVLTLFDTTNALTNTMDIPSWVINGAHALHITKVCCEVDAGTTTINLQRDDVVQSGGSVANILSGNLTCSVNVADPSGAPGTGCTSSFVSGEDAIAIGNKIDFVMVSAGTAKRMNLIAVYTVD